MTVFEPPHHTEKPIISSPSTVISAPSFLNNPNLLLGGNLTAVGPELSHFDDVMHSHGDDGRVAQERTMTADQGVEYVLLWMTPPSRLLTWQTGSTINRWHVLLPTPVAIASLSKLHLTMVESTP